MKKNLILKILFYIIIYSFLGFLIETIYAIFTKWTLESRKSFVYGPFCIIYGIAAVILIFSLKKYKSKNIKLFVYGMILGCSIEYFSSLIGEIFLHAIWWDYSNDFLNINGRTCLYYAILWGILSVLLINWVNPFINYLYYKLIKCRYFNILIKSTSVFLLFDIFITCVALNNFLNNVSMEYKINIKGINGNNNEIISKYFPNEKMIKIYPNIIVTDNNRKTTYLESVFGDVKNYYYKFGKNK